MGEDKNERWDLYEALESVSNGNKIVRSEFKLNDGLYLYWEDGTTGKIVIKYEDV